MSAVPELTPVAARQRTALAQGGFLIAGSGSVGRRHYENLVGLGAGDVAFYRTGHRDPHAPAPAAPAIYDLELALACRPRAVLVCNPTSEHLATALAAVRAGAHVLIEKPVADRLEGTDELASEIRRRAVVALVGFQYRFHPALQQIKRWLGSHAIGEVVSGSVRWGEHLPSWHPGEDWRAGYAARADLGGGAVRTLCHPFDYLRWLLGEADWVSAESSNRALSLDVEDTAHVTLRFVSGALVSVSLDYLRRPREHAFELVGTRGRVSWSESDGVAELHPAQEPADVFVPHPGQSRNTMFLAEMRHFLDCIEGHAAPLCPLEDGIAALELATAALESARCGRRVRARRSQ